MKYLLAVSGSIACYKSLDITRMLVKQGHQVRVILTAGALEFIKAETFRYLGADQVYLPQDDFNPNLIQKGENVLHVELAKWADKLIVAPLSANTLARLSLGLNNDLLGSVYLAFGARPILFFPAMNTQMWKSPATQNHLQKLKEISNLGLINPVSGQLVCGDIGEGKFPEVNAVVDLIQTYDPTQKSDKKIIITAGATAAPLDPVRYMTNPSSGKMGIAVAKAFLKCGHKVTVLAGHQCTEEINFLLGHPNFQLVKTPTTESMKNAALNFFPEADLYISTGAIADIEFETVKDKIKKESMKDALPFHQAADILKEILSLKTPKQKVISFAAETQTTKEVFEEKMKRKPVNLMIGNKVSNGLIGDEEVVGFQKSEGEYYFVSMNSIQGPTKLSKEELGEKLVQWFEGKTC
ncbi:MAG: bifunctional phosphopantothenoylcysteine decarboxylase/phosphopantothenate--cysteine ligase CoaBC [Bacteriovoracaceae bacterium]